MGSISKNLALILILIVVISLLTFLKVGPVYAQPIPTPSAPQFTVELVDHSYDVAPKTTSTIDPYNGKNITKTIPGYHVQKFTIDLTINNQNFPSTLNGNKSNLYYNVRIKGHFEQGWNELYPYTTTSIGSLQQQSSSDHTILSFPANYRVGDQIDFQVQAVLGYQYSYETTFYGQTTHIIPMQVNSFIYKSSAWSQTQTFAMPTQSASPSPTPTVPEFPFIIFIAITLFVLSLMILVFKRK